MEKICIVKRRRPIQEPGTSVTKAAEEQVGSPLLRIELTPEQAETVRTNTNFKRLFTDSEAPIYLNLHFGAGLPQKLLTAREVCQMLQVSRHTLDRLVASGSVKSYRIGRLRRFSAEDVMDYLAGSFEQSRLRSVRVDIVGQAQRALEAGSAASFGQKQDFGQR